MLPPEDTGVTSVGCKTGQDSYSGPLQRVAQRAGHVLFLFGTRNMYVFCIRSVVRRGVRYRADISFRAMTPHCSALCSPTLSFFMNGQL